MSVEELCALPVRSIAAENCMLCTWATWPKLKEAIQVIEAWGFRYLTCLFVWVKLNPNCETDPLHINKYDLYSGLGWYSNSGTEFCLLARRGKPLPRNVGDVRQVILAPRRGIHSTKPAIFRNEIVRLFGKQTTKIELFARRRAEGWVSWGLDIGEEAAGGNRLHA